MQSRRNTYRDRILRKQAMRRAVQTRALSIETGVGLGMVQKLTMLVMAAGRCLLTAASDLVERQERRFK
jgi:hypothetical protein